MTGYSPSPLQDGPVTKPLSAHNVGGQFIGSAVVSTGSNYAVISTTAIKSGDIPKIISIQGAPSVVGSSHSPFVINSIVAAVGFVIVTGDAKPVPIDRTVFWELDHTQ